MKHVPHFNEFLSGHVNLNQSRLDKLESHVTAVTGFLKNHLEGYRKYSQQGSYAHKTIIKPVQDNDEFDADILVLIEDDDFDPSNFQTDYVDKVYKVLKENDTYKSKVKRKTRCMMIDYTGDFHLDVVPCVEHDNEFYICNRTDGKYEKTDGEGYKRWLIEKNQIIGGNNFRKVTRLLKFLRGHKSNFSVKSILLTTILGDRIDKLDEESNDFSDLPTTLKTLSNRVNDFLQEHRTMPIIYNPVLSEENFNRHWDDTKYNNFRDKFDLYNSKINYAFDEKDPDESVKKWRTLFGDDFGDLKDSDSTTSNATILTATALPLGATPDPVEAKKPFALDD